VKGVLKALARKAWEHNLTPIPTKDKKPLIAWGEYIYRKMTVLELQEALRLIRTEFAVITGQKLVNNKYLVVVDIDDPLQYDFDIPYYATRTRRGFHIPYYTTYSLPSMKLEGIEIHSYANLIMFPCSLIDDVFYDGYPQFYFDPPEMLPKSVLELFQMEKQKKKKKKKNGKTQKAEEEIEAEVAEAGNGTSELLKELVQVIRPYYYEGMRHNIVMGVSAYLRKRGFTKADIIKLFRLLPDTEDRTPQIEATFSKDYDEIASYLWCPEVVDALHEFFTKGGEVE